MGLAVVTIKLTRIYHGLAYHLSIVETSFSNYPAIRAEDVVYCSKRDFNIVVAFSTTTLFTSFDNNMVTSMQFSHLK